jgi:hypothetical protein
MRHLHLRSPRVISLLRRVITRSPSASTLNPAAAFSTGSGASTSPSQAALLAIGCCQSPGGWCRQAPDVPPANAFMATYSSGCSLARSITTATTYSADTIAIATRARGTDCRRRANAQPASSASIGMTNITCGVRHRASHAESPENRLAQKLLPTPGECGGCALAADSAVAGRTRTCYKCEAGAPKSEGSVKCKDKG